jgi:hypothetical protein
MVRLVLTSLLKVHCKSGTKISCIHSTLCR